MSVWVMISTAKSSREANRMARELVRGKLAACVSVFPGVTSHFSWEGKVTREREAVLLVKTTGGNAGKIIKKMKEIHAYQLPEILFFRVAGGEKRYLDWVEKSTGERNKKRQKTKKY